VTTADDGVLRTCLVVGTGLIGTSVALALRRHGVVVHLADRDPPAARQAAQLGAGSLEQPTEQVDLAVVAVSPSATAEVVSGLLAGNVAATVVDTAAVKAGVLREVAAVVGPAPHFVGTHPMAGRERSGPGAARADLFEGRPWAIATAGADERSLARVRALLDLCGAVAVEMDAAAHDAAVALVSHVPQVAASLVAARLAEGDETALALTGQGLRDVTRVAASDPDLWVDILAANAEPVARILTELRQDVDAVVHALREVDEDPEWARTSLREVLLRGNAGRARLPGKHGGRSTPYAVVPVVLADRPGELARLVVDVGAAGVNIEDIRIEHSPGQPVGLVELAVAPGAEAGLGVALEGLGWVVHVEGA
jgi:prephenate dehydrogenase